MFEALFICLISPSLHDLTTSWDVAHCWHVLTITLALCIRWCWQVCQPVGLATPPSVWWSRVLIKPSSLKRPQKKLTWSWLGCSLASEFFICHAELFFSPHAQVFVASIWVLWLCFYHALSASTSLCRLSHPLCPPQSQGENVSAVVVQRGQTVCIRI